MQINKFGISSEGKGVLDKNIKIKYGRILPVTGFKDHEQKLKKHLIISHCHYIQLRGINLTSVASLCFMLK